ncbi:MAG: TonB-dependent receptor family protein, partial [Sulfurifustaceae bacterium]
MKTRAGFHRMKRLLVLLALVVTDAFAADEAADQTTSAPPPLPMAPIVITPTRTEQSSFDLPVSIDVLGPERIQNAQAQVNLSESLVRVPGVVAQNRQNYAQDLQISSRGFGARSTFGVRGVRLFADSIPATSPDGQGQAATFDLSTAQRIEVMRGPFSALYGNSSGGVIAYFTEDGPPAPTVTVDAEAGTFGTSKFGVKFGGEAGALNYLAHASRFDTDGYREHSAATRDQINSKFRYRLSDDASLTFIAAALHQPDTQDPLGLKRAQVEQNPRQAGDNAIAFNTRKSILHDQEGLVYDQRLNEQDSLRVLGYTGNRQVTQFLAIPLTAQDAVTSSGGVVDLDRGFYGTDARFTRKTSLIDRPLTVTVGVAYDNQDELRKGFRNENGDVGALKRNEDDRVYNVDEYAQAEWRFAPRWSGTLGVRHSAVRFNSIDHFIVPLTANGDDSGSVTYRATNPVAGVLYNLTPSINLYANAGRGFETPTFAELAYRPDNTSGLNFALQPSVSQNYEIGMKSLLGPQARLNLALFHIDTNHEIVVATNSGGRTTFQNAGKTERNGAELSFDSTFGQGLGGYVALAFVNAEYAESFTTGTTVIPSGNKIPGVPRYTAYGELSWRHAPLRFETALEARWNGKTFVNDANT